MRDHCKNRICNCLHCTGKTIYSCHFNTKLGPNNSWKFFYKEQQRQEHEQKRNKILRQLARFQSYESMQRFRDYLEQTKRDIQWSKQLQWQKQKPKDVESSSVIPWQQRYIRKLEPPPCPRHGYDRKLTSDEMRCKRVLVPTKPVCGQRPNIQPPWPNVKDHVNPCQLQSRWRKGPACYLYQNSGNNYMSGKRMY